MAVKGLQITSLETPSGIMASNAFAKIDPAEVVGNSSGGVNVFAVVKYYKSEADFDSGKQPLSMDLKNTRVTLTYTLEEWKNVNQASAYDKLEDIMTATSENGGFGWTGVSQILYTN